jgi:hypothetical protein
LLRTRGLKERRRNLSLAIRQGGGPASPGGQDDGEFHLVTVLAIFAALALTFRPGWAGLLTMFS